MKRLTALLLCFLLLCTCSVTAFAAEPEAEETNTVISVTVPDSHKITVTAENAKVFYEGVSGEEFIVERLSEPRLLIRAESGKVIKSVMINGEDVTEELHGGYLDLAPVYEDKVITVTTEDEPVAPKETYTVKGKVTLNGQPLSEVDLELRSTLKTTKTDKNGKRTMRMTNNTSLDYTLNFGGNPVQLRAFTSRNVTVAKDKELIFTVENMWIPTEEKHPQFKLKL